MNCFILFNEAKLWNKLFFQSTIFCRFIFNWKIIALQYCVSAMQSRESPINMHISPPFWTPLSPPLGRHRAPGWAPCVTEASHWRAIIHMVMYTFQCYPFDLSHSFLPLLWQSTVFKNWSIIDLQQFGCTAKWFSYTCVYIFFFRLFSFLGYYVECSLSCYTVGPCCLSILYIQVCEVKSWSRLVMSNSLPSQGL